MATTLDIPESASSSTPKILVYIPRLDEHPRFWPHFCVWFALNYEKYKLGLEYTYRRLLHKGQNEVVVKAREVGCTHILFVEDDHWGFPLEGLDVLLEADKDHIGLHTFARQRPALSLAYRKRDPSVSLLDDDINLRPIEKQKGEPMVQAVDLLGFGFTLVRVDLFDKLNENPFAYCGNKSTDSQLCQAMLDVGISPHVHFGWTLAHGDVHPDMRLQYQKTWDLMGMVEMREAALARGKGDLLEFKEEMAQKTIQMREKVYNHAQENYNGGNKG